MLFVCNNRTRNGKEIVNSDKYQLSVDEGGVNKLVVVGLKPEDFGDYVLSAVNPAGSLKCTATLAHKGDQYVLNLGDLGASTAHVGKCNHILEWNHILVFALFALKETTFNDSKITLLCGD